MTSVKNVRADTQTTHVMRPVSVDDATGVDRDIMTTTMVIITTIAVATANEACKDAADEMDATDVETVTISPVVDAARAENVANAMMVMIVE